MVYNVNKGILIYPDQTQFYGNNLHCLEKSDLVAYVTDQGAVVDGGRDRGKSPVICSYMCSKG